MTPLARYKPSKDFSPSCSDLLTMSERELSAFFRAVDQLFGSEQAQLSAEDWLREFDRERWSARFNPRISIDHDEGFDSARKSGEHFVPIQRNTNCLGG
jgi:hypothetical protein